MIAPINSGMQTDLKSWLIPDDAFAQLNNAYVFRGRVRKRFGSRLMRGTTPPTLGYEQLQSRLRINIGITSGAGALAGTVPGDVFAVGQMFSIGNQIYTVTTASVAPLAMLNTGGGSGTYRTDTGVYAFLGAAFTATVFFYPALPVMGLVTHEQSAISDELAFAFDTRFSYQFTTAGWSRVGTALWSGNDSEFFWGTNWRGLTSDQTFLFVTNYKSADGIKYYDGANWATMTPIVNNTNRLETARVILPFKDRLIALNCIERAQGVQFSAPNNTSAATGNFNQTVAGVYVIGQQFIVGNTIFTVTDVTTNANTAMTVSSLTGIGTPPTATFNGTTGLLIITGNGNNRNLPVYYFDSTTGAAKTFVNRCRFSLNGDPTRTNGWIDQQPGLGGYIDAPTKEAIVTAQFLKDRLIVYFEASTWELVYNGNNMLPFVWQQINTELGAESTFSQVSFDKVILGIGNVGVHSCNGSNVERIDDKIPDKVFSIHNESQGVQRVAGVRDFYVEMVYWAYANVLADGADPYNNRVLVYNYKNGSWSVNNDSITAFGYYQAAANTGETWESDGGTWESDETTWEDGPNVQAKFKSVIAGNQEGFVFIVDADIERNCPAIQITNMTNVAGVVTITAINHNFEPGFSGQGDYIAIESVQGASGFIRTIYPVNSIVDANSFTILVPGFAGTYTGGGTCARVSNIGIVTKQYNFYVNQGRNAFISKVDFLVDKTSGGQVTIDYAIGSSSESQLSTGQLTGAIIGNSILETSPYALVPLEQTQDRLWHPVYLQADGESVQLNIYMSESQLLDNSIAWSDFEMHAMTFYATPTSSRLQ